MESMFVDAGGYHAHAHAQAHAHIHLLTQLYSHLRTTYLATHLPARTGMATDKGGKKGFKCETGAAGGG